VYNNRKSPRYVGFFVLKGRTQRRIDAKNKEPQRHEITKLSDGMISRPMETYDKKRQPSPAHRPGLQPGLKMHYSSVGR